jgi:hypothetical protein
MNILLLSSFSSSRISHLFRVEVNETRIVFLALAEVVNRCTPTFRCRN